MMEGRIFLSNFGRKPFDSVFVNIGYYVVEVTEYKISLMNEVLQGSVDAMRMFLYFSQTDISVIKIAEWQLT